MSCKGCADRDAAICKLHDEIERMKNLLGDAFDAGSAWSVGTHSHFRQSHKDKDGWVAQAITEINAPAGGE